MKIKVNVALIGAKGFGKSSFLKRGVGRIYRRLKGVIGDRKRLDDYNDVSIAPTNEKDPIARCVYKSRKEEPGFEISFFEYAGELAAKEIDAGIKGTCLRVMYNWFFAWLPENWCPRWLSAIALAYKIKSADAAIVMLPADLDKYDSPEDDDESQTDGRTNAEREVKPPRYDLGSFRTNIESWLSKSKGRPMFVAINKCDKLSKDEIDDFSKVFKKRMLGEIYRNLCDTIGENQIGKVMISISPRKSDDSFIEKLDDKEKIQEFEKDTSGLLPFGVKELIESVVDRVNHVRAENVKKTWETAGWLKRAFFMPFFSLRSLIRGTTDKGVVTINASGWIRFFSMCFSITLAVFLTVLGVCCLLEYKSEKDFQSRLEIQSNDLSILTPNDFKCNNEFLTQSTWVRPLFFSGRITNLRDKADGVRRDFVAWLENDLMNSLNGVRVRRLDPWDVEPRVNIERSTMRMNMISNHFARIPDGEQSAVIVAAEKEEKKYVADAENDLLFDKNLYDLGAVPRERKVRAFARMLELFKDKADARKTDYSRLKDVMQNLEAELSLELKSKLTELEKRFTSENWEGRVQRLEAKNSLIKASLGQFVLNGATFKHWDEAITEQEAKIEHEKVYGPFDLAYATIMADNGKGVLIRIAEFKKTYPQENYKDRKLEYGKLLERECSLTKALESEIAKVKVDYGDKESSLMQIRINRAESRIKAFWETLKEFKPESPEAANLQRKIDAEKKWIADHRIYVSFDEKLKKIEDLPLRERVRPYIAFLSRHSEKDYPEYANRIRQVQERCRTSETNILSQLQVYLNGDRTAHKAESWQSQIGFAKRRQERIKIDRELVGDRNQEILGAELVKEARQIQSLEHYGPFDDQFNEVSRHEGPGTLLRIAEFKARYSKNDYSLRKEKFTELEGKEKKVRKALWDGVSNFIKAHPDVEDQTMTNRILNAISWRREYESLRNKFVPSGADAAKVVQEIQKIDRWIVDHEVYLTYDSDWLPVSMLSPRKRILPAIGFLASHSEKDYPEYKERMSQVRKEIDDATEELLSELRERLDASRNEHNTGSWQTLVDVAKERQKLIAETRKKVGPESKIILDDLDDKEQRMIEKLTRNGEFDDALAKVKASPLRYRIEEIESFRHKFKPIDYKDRTSDYRDMAVLETNVIGEVDRRFKESISKLKNPPSMDFAGRHARSAEIRKACEDALLYIPSNHFAAAQYKVKLVAAGSDEKKFGTWNRLKISAGQIITATNENAKTVMMRLGDFKKNFPRPNPMPQELESIYAVLDNIQREKERVLVGEIEAKLSKCEPPMRATEKEKQKSLEAKIQVLKSGIGYFIEQSAPWNRYSLLRDNLVSELSSERRRSMFFDALALLNKSLEKKMKALEKIGKIDDFVKNHPKDLYKDKEFEVVFKKLDDQRTSLEKESEWELLIADVNGLQRPKTDIENANRELQTYRSKCEQMIEDMNTRFGKRSEFAPRVADKQRKLDREISWVGELIGDGTWTSVLELQQRWQDEPTDENIVKYRDALTSFDVDRSVNSKYKSEQEKALKILTEDCDNKKKCLEARAEFKRRPNAHTFETLRTSAVEFYKQRLNNKIATKEIESLYNWANGIQSGSIDIGSTIKWVGFDFENSGLQTWYGDNEVKLYVGGAEVGGLCKVRKNKWEISDNNHRNWGEASIERGFSFKLDGAGVTTPPEEMKILVVNYGCQPDRSGDGSISFWELVAKDTADFDHVVSLNCREVKKGGLWNATITLRFSGVNVCP